MPTHRPVGAVRERKGVRKTNTQRSVLDTPIVVVSQAESRLSGGSSSETILGVLLVPMNRHLAEALRSQVSEFEGNRGDSYQRSPVRT